MGYADDSPSKIVCVGTAFIIDYKSAGYLVTAKHVAWVLGDTHFLIRLPTAICAIMDLRESLIRRSGAMSAIMCDPVSGVWTLKCGTCTAVFTMKGEMILRPDLQEAICPHCGVPISLIHLKGAVQGLLDFQKSLEEAKRPTLDHRRFSKVIPPGFEE